MRYSEGSLRLLHDDLSQARYCYQMVNEEGCVIKKQVARNFHAASQKEAVLEKARIRDQLEREALIEDMLPCQKKNPKLSKFMFEQIDGMLKSGLAFGAGQVPGVQEAAARPRRIADLRIQNERLTSPTRHNAAQDLLRGSSCSREVPRPFGNACLKWHIRRLLHLIAPMARCPQTRPT